MSNIFFGDLFLFHLDHLNQYLEGEEDYEIPIFIYTTPHQYDFLFAGGIADDNWVDGTQSFVYIHQPRFLTDIGFGHSYTVAHEAGHHVSLAHPHDGYDSELNISYGPFGSSLLLGGR